MKRVMAAVVLVFVALVTAGCSSISAISQPPPPNPVIMYATVKQTSSSSGIYFYAAEVSIWNQGGSGSIRLTITGTKSVGGVVQPATLYDSGDYYMNENQTIPSWYAAFSSNVPQSAVTIESWVRQERKSSITVNVSK